MSIDHLYQQISHDPDFHICKVFLQFERYGVLIYYDALILEDQGLIRHKKHRFIELPAAVSVIQITHLGRRKLAHMQERWENHFVPKYELPNNDLPDDYLTEADDYFWAFSNRRLEREREAGNLHQAVEFIL